VFDSIGELSDGSFVNVGRNPVFRSRNRRLFGGRKSISVDGFVCLIFTVELLVLLPSPAPVLEHELASSFGLETFSTKEKKKP
jgi:hypothetical protein